MFTKDELEKFRSADISSCNIKNLTDVTKLMIDIDEPIINRAQKYLKDVKNPYMIRVGDVGVKINCGSGKNLSDCIINIVSSQS